MREKIKKLLRGNWLVTWLKETPPGLFILCVCLIAFGLSLPFTLSGYVVDDHYFRMIFQGAPGMPEISFHFMDMFAFLSADEDLRQKLLDRGALPWWTPPGAQVKFFRPLTVLTHYADYVAWNGTAWVDHLHSSLWYVLVAGAVAVLYRRLITPAWTAALAALLYAIEDAHALPAGWLSNRNALLCTFFGVVALLGHHHWRERQSVLGVVIAVPALVLGLLSGEAAVGIGGYLLAYALFLDRGTWFNRFATLVPYGVVVVVYRIYYKLAGFGVEGSRIYLDPASEPLQFLREFPRNLLFLMQGQFGTPESTLPQFIPPPFVYIYGALAVAFLGWCAWSLAPLIRSDRTAQFWIVGTVVSAVPVCAVFAQDRLLMFPSIGAMGLIAQFVAGYRERAPWVRERRAWRGPAKVLVWYFCVVHLVLAPMFFLVQAGLMTNTNAVSARLSRSAGIDPGVAEDTYIIINTIHDNLAIGFALARSSMGDPAPKHTRALSAGPRAIKVTRVDERTIALEPEGGFFPAKYGQLIRDIRDYPFEMGDTVTVEGMTVEVKKVLPDGRPKVIHFRFEKPLEHPQYRTVTWRDSLYIPVNLPPAGESITIPGVRELEALEAWWSGDKESVDS